MYYKTELLKIRISADREHLYVLYESQRKQRIVSYTKFTYMFFTTEIQCFYCAVETEFLNRTVYGWFLRD